MQVLLSIREQKMNKCKEISTFDFCITVLLLILLLARWFLPDDFFPPFVICSINAAGFGIALCSFVHSIFDVMPTRFQGLGSILLSLIIICTIAVLIFTICKQAEYPVRLNDCLTIGALFFSLSINFVVYRICKIVEPF